MSGPPFTKFYWGEFSRETAAFGLREHGAYIQLLRYAWDHDATVPADDVELARLVHATPDEWAEIKVMVLSLFKAFRGRWKHPWIARQLATFSDISRKRSIAGKSGGSATHGTTRRNSQAIAKQLPTYTESETDSRSEPMAKPESKTSDSEFSPPGASREISIEDMARRIYDVLPPLSQRKTGHDSLRIRRAIEARVAMGENARDVANAAYLYATNRAHQREQGKFAAQLHKLIEVGFPPLWVQSGKTLPVPETIAGRPLEWSAPAGPIAPPMSVAALSTITVDGHSFEVPPDVDPGMNSVWAERTIRHQLERIQEWRTDYRGLWQSNAWGPEPGKPGCRIWPSVLAFCNVDVTPEPERRTA